VFSLNHDNSFHLPKGRQVRVKYRKFAKNVYPTKTMNLSIQSKMCLTHPPDPQRLRFLHLTGWVPSIWPALFDAMAPRDDPPEGRGWSCDETRWSLVLPSHYEPPPKRAL
jgi:hypothetical protein